MDNKIIIEAYSNAYSYSSDEEIVLYASANESKLIQIELIKYPNLTIAFQENGIAINNQKTNENCFAEGCGWRSTWKYKIDSSLTAGLYFIRLSDEENSRINFHLPIIIKETNVRNSAIVLMNTNTWQAYNTYGGASFYKYLLPGSTKWGRDERENYGVTCVSFNRPNVRLSNEIKRKLLGLPDIKSHLLLGELYLIDWLLYHKYKFDLLDDKELENPESLRPYKTIILNCHPEYWSNKMFKTIKEHISLRKNIINLGGNVAWGRVNRIEHKMQKMGNPFDVVPEKIEESNETWSIKMPFNSGNNNMLNMNLWYKSPQKGDSVSIRSIKLNNTELSQFGSSGILNYCIYQLRKIERRLPTTILLMKKYVIINSGKGIKRKLKNKKHYYECDGDTVTPQILGRLIVKRNKDYNLIIKINKKGKGLLNFRILDSKSKRINSTFKSPKDLLGIYYDIKGLHTYSGYEILAPNHWVFDGIKEKNFGFEGRNGGGASGHETDKTNSKWFGNTKHKVLAKGKNPNSGGGEMVCFKIGEANVFSVGSVSFTGSLSVDKSAAQILKNVLKRFEI